MEMLAPADADERCTTALRAAGMRVTSQRLVVHRVLHELDRHATAEEVRRAVGSRLPALSLPTVYATLDVLARLGLARRVDGAGDAVLYDPHTDDHAHFRCRTCGTVLDVAADVDVAPLLRAAKRAGLSTDGFAVTLTGQCAGCAATA